MMRFERWRLERWWGVLAGILAWTLASCAATAQEPWMPAVGSPWTPGSKLISGHTWFVAPLPLDPTGAAQFLLLHAPPRDSAGDSPAGTMRPVARLGARPEAMAAWEGEVHMVFSPSAAGGGGGQAGAGRQRRVVRMTAVTPRLGLAAWEYIPSSGPEVRPSLPGDGELIAACGTAIGPAVLMLGAEGTSGLRLLVLRGETWMASPLPDAIQAAIAGKGAGDGAGQRSAWLDMVATRGGPLIAWITPGAIEYSTAVANLTAVRAEDGDAIVTRWETAIGGAAGGGAGERATGLIIQAPRDRRVVWADGQLGVIERDGDEPVRVAALHDGRATPLTTIAGPLPVGVAPLDGMGRLVVLKADASGTPAASSAGPRLQITEVSLYTGEVLFAGPASGKLFSGWPLQVLMIGIGAIMLAVLMFVLRSESNEAMPLPDGFALAPPGRRFLAAVIDGALAILVSSIIHGVAPLKILSPMILLRPSENSAPLLTALVIAFGTSVLLEWMTGRTLGKRMIGLGVVGYRRAGPSKDGQEPLPADANPLQTPVRVGDLEMGRPSLIQAVVRNAIRWFIPPLAALVLFDSNWRHPGDVLAKTLVLTPAREPEDADTED
jgi:hypothetical protein